MKNTKVIDWNDFAGGVATFSNARNKLADAMSESSKTLLRRSAMALPKQVNKYSHSCQDIAVFDWNTMFLFSFRDSDLDNLDPIPVKGTYFRESETTGPTTFRLVLLGFITNALRSCQSRNGLPVM